MTILLLCTSFLISCTSQMEIIKAKLITPKIASEGESSISYLQKANRFYELEKFDSVLVYCHKSYAENSQNWELYSLYGKTASQTRRYELANNYFYKALSLCSSDPINRAKIYYVLGENEDSLGNEQKAKQHYLMAIQLNSDSELAQSAYKKMQLLSHTN